MQSKKMSLLETCLSTLIGFVIAILSQHFLFPIWGIEVEWHENFEIACVFTVISILRGYGVRRLFNWIHHKEPAIMPATDPTMGGIIGYGTVKAGGAVISMEPREVQPIIPVPGSVRSLHVSELTDEEMDAIQNADTSHLPKGD